MAEAELSPPNLISDGVPLNDYIDMIYSDFYKNFIDRNNRPLLLGNFIFLSNEHIDNKLERFWHLISLGNEEKYNIFPCTNDYAYLRCNTKCEVQNSIESVKQLSRAECMYRMARIHWISEIIDLANKNNKYIKCWTKTSKDNRQNYFIRYEKDLIDYVIIFNEVHKKGKLNYYKFTTAYPVFYKRMKQQFNEDYSKYLGSKK
ncbi:MAG: hypothetical protein VB130_09755 [Clostridium sp.]|nr:hypothetical protein [Clostridium sp.]